MVAGTIPAGTVFRTLSISNECCMLFSKLILFKLWLMLYAFLSLALVKMISF